MQRVLAQLELLSIDAKKRKAGEEESARSIYYKRIFGSGEEPAQILGKYELRDKPSEYIIDVITKTRPTLKTIHTGDFFYATIKNWDSLFLRNPGATFYCTYKNAVDYVRDPDGTHRDTRGLPYTWEELRREVEETEIGRWSIRKFVYTGPSIRAYDWSAQELALLWGTEDGGASKMYEKLSELGLAVYTTRDYESVVLPVAQYKHLREDLQWENRARAVDDFYSWFRRFDKRGEARVLLRVELTTIDTEQLFPSDVHLKFLFVNPSAAGKDDLFALILEHLKESCKRFRVGVVATTTGGESAISLYEKGGFIRIRQLRTATLLKWFPAKEKNDFSDTESSSEFELHGRGYTTDDVPVVEEDDADKSANSAE